MSAFPDREVFEYYCGAEGIDGAGIIQKFDEKEDGVEWGRSNVQSQSSPGEGSSGIDVMTREISEGHTLTDKEGYEAMLRFLYKYWDRTRSIDLTDILRGAEYVAPNRPADTTFWDYWQEAIDYVKGGGEPLMKVWMSAVRGRSK